MSPDAPVDDQQTVARASVKLTRSQVQQVFLLAIVLGITVLLLVMLRGFLMTIMLAGVFAAMSRPVFTSLSDRLGGRGRLASALTVMGLFLLVVVPIAAFLALVVGQTVEVSEQAGPWLREQATRWPALTAWAENLPLVGEFVPDQTELARRAGQLVSGTGTFLLNSVGAATSGTVNMVLQLFVMLYALYFFLLDGERLLKRILFYVPLDEEDERQLVNQFVSVTRATIKGSILVGLIQGGLAGAAFFILGLPGAAFWTTVMAVLSVIPVLGSGLVWFPASVILMLTGRAAAGLGLMIWGAVIVGMVDNVLRPRFVGRDTKMHDLMVLLSTFGGLSLFGVVGFIVGPIIGALFVTGWGLYGAEFGDALPGSLDEAPLLAAEIEVTPEPDGSAEASSPGESGSEGGRAEEAERG